MHYLPLAEAPKLNLDTIGGGQFQTFTQYVAAAIIAAWIFYVIAQYAFPSRRIGQGMRQVGRPLVLVMVVVTLACCIDLRLVDVLITAMFKMADAVSALIKQFFGQTTGG